jgi:hypothetical protein
MQCMHSAQRAAAAAATCSAAKSHTTLSLTRPSTHTGGRVSCASLHLASPPSPQQQPASTEAETRDGGKNGILLGERKIGRRLRLRMLEQPQQQPESRARLCDVGISTAATPTAMKKPTAAGRGWRTGSARPVACPLAAQTGYETGERPSGGFLRERGGRIGEGDRAQRAERTAPPNWTMQCMLSVCAVLSRWEG